MITETHVGDYIADFISFNYKLLLLSSVIRNRNWNAFKSNFAYYKVNTR